MTHAQLAEPWTGVERRIQFHHSCLASEEFDESKFMHADSMMTLLQHFPLTEDFFYHPFSHFRFCTLRSTDDRLRIFNWNVPLQNGEHVYYGLILVHDLVTHAVTSIVLKDNRVESEKADTRFYDQENWPGALYYEIIANVEKKRSQVSSYTLLGWDGRDYSTTGKVLDVVQILGPDKVRFGAGIFESELGTKKRVSLAYSEEVSASVKYYPRKKCIVMDHLSPKNPVMNGVWADYGPDGTYDLYQWEKGKWKLYRHIDISVFSSSDNKPYQPPR
jgi:hypothetical protein